MLAACSSMQDENISPAIDSLADLSIIELRERRFGSSITIEERPGSDKRYGG
jgi:hypothetical protein